MTTFEREYQEELRIRAAYEKADKADNEAGREAARSEINMLWDSINAKGNAYIRIARDYKDAKDKGNTYLDFHDVIWDTDVKDLIGCLRENGIDHFTFSSTWSSAVNTAWLFTENGCELEGIVQVNGNRDFFNEEYEKAPAYLFRVK